MQEKPAHALAGLWPDEVNHLLCRLQSPRMLLRLEILPNDNLNVVILRQAEHLETPHQIKLVLEAIQFAVEDDLIEKPENFTLTQNFGFPLPPYYVVSVPQMNATWIDVIHTDDLSTATGFQAYILLQNYKAFHKASLGTPLNFEKPETPKA